VTACLLEERRELESSPFLTEVAANAVEGLVFGQLYDSVYEECVLETQELDVALWRKITALEREHAGTVAGSLISEPAIAALKMLPEAHSAADKLYFCVKFLDGVSDHFTSNTSRAVCADSLLKMVCQHFVCAENIGGLNAQIAFLEEFARDEQLLRGREGYALVTMQASLHFLNMESTDLQRDIFAEEDGDASEIASSSEEVSSTVSLSSQEGGFDENDEDDSSTSFQSCKEDEEES